MDTVVLIVIIFGCIVASISAVVLFVRMHDKDAAATILDIVGDAIDSKTWNEFATKFETRYKSGQFEGILKKTLEELKKIKNDLDK